MHPWIRELAETLNGPHTGNFKPTRSLAKRVGLEGHKDYARIDATTEVVILPEAGDYWQELFKENSTEENTIFYGFRELVEGAFFKKRTPIMTLVILPARYNSFNKGKDYSVDQRSDRGSAHIALDVRIDKERLEKVKSILETDPSCLNEALVETELSYNKTPFNVYEHFIAGHTLGYVQARDTISRNLRLEDSQLPVFRTSSLKF